MEAAFHYRLKVRLCRKAGIDETNPDFITQEIKDYVNRNPILAREEVFSDFKEWIWWLYQGSLNIPYTDSDWQNRIDIASIIPEDTKEQNNIVFDFRNHVDFGIHVYLVIDKPIENDYWKISKLPDLSDNIKAMFYQLEIGKEYLIHGISNNYISIDQLADNLSTELEYYDYYKYEKQNQVKIEYFDIEFEKTIGVNVLNTPLEWEKCKYDDYIRFQKLNAEEESEKIQSISQVDNSYYQYLISEGESNLVEFKPSMLYGFKYENYFEESRWNVAKSIAAFLNGPLNKVGLLFIGIKDNGNLNGLEDTDFKLSTKGNPRDYFKLEFDKLITYFIGNSVIGNLELKLLEILGKTIAVIEVTPCKFPVYVHYDKSKNTRKDFFLRAQASSRLLEGDDLKNYLIQKFNNQL